MKNILIKTIAILFLQLFANYDWQWTTSAYSVLNVFGRLDNLPEQSFIEKTLERRISVISKQVILNLHQSA